MSTNEIIGILLAGGKSRRFGRPKAFAERNSVPFFQYSIEALKDVVDEIVLVTNTTLKPQFNVEEQNVHVICDQETYKGEGPLAGIYTAMDSRPASWYLVVPVDVPFIRSSVLEALVMDREGNHQAIVPVVSGKQQPLIALYHHSIKDKIETQLLGSERSLKALFNNIKVKFVDIDSEDSFININSKADYQKFINLEAME